MRLHHRDHLSVARFARRLEHRRDLHRMMPVVVDHRNAVPFAGAGEAAAHAGKARATATAAVALSALWRPGMGSARSEIACACAPMRSRNTTLNFEWPLAWVRSTRRASACGFSP